MRRCRSRASSSSRACSRSSRACATSTPSIATAGSVATVTGPAVATEPAWRRRYRATRVGFPVWAHDDPDRLIYLSNASGRFEVHAWDRRAGAHRPGAAPPAGAGYRVPRRAGPSGGRGWGVGGGEGDELGGGGGGAGWGGPPAGGARRRRPPPHAGG